MISKVSACMADTLIARTALGCTEASGLRTRGDAAVVMLRELPAAAMIDLRLDPADAAAMSAAHDALSLDLPLTPGKTGAGAERIALWFGPDQWLIVAPSAAATPLLQALGGDAMSAVDVSDLRAEFELAGPRAADVLRKGCAIDLHPRIFGTGDCALTSFARVRVALRQTDDRPAYRVLVERSVAAYLWDWLIDAMMEYGDA
jgi:sarcosine oxidase subunit gamma